jgi:hypothetical protein
MRTETLVRGPQPKFRKDLDSRPLIDQHYASEQAICNWQLATRDRQEFYVRIINSALRCNEY